MNILLLGSDSRGATTSVGAAGVSDQRSDTMMLVHIDADRKNVYVMSIMRDLWVPIPGNGTAKINAALAWGGTPLAIQTVEQLLGARIDHVAIIDFQGLKAMTDALGGVDVDSPVAFTTVKSPHYTFSQGLNHLDGDQALAFARERYAFATADYQRVADQQALLRGILNKLLRPPSHEHRPSSGTGRQAEALDCARMMATSHPRTRVGRAERRASEQSRPRRERSRCQGAAPSNQAQHGRVDKAPLPAPRNRRVRRRTSRPAGPWKWDGKSGWGKDVTPRCGRR